MIRLRDKDTGADLGTISEDELRFLVDQMEEEWADDRDYYISSAMLEILKERGADAGLISLLTKAVGGREGVEVEWDRE